MLRVFRPRLAVILAVLVSGGCASVQRATPQAPGRVNIKLKDGDYKVLASVKGSSTTTSYAGGLVQVIDGHKVRVFGIRFYEEQCCVDKHLDAVDCYLMLYPIVGWSIVAYRHSKSTEDRAAYKVVAAVPDADAMTDVGMVKQRSGVPLICSEEEVAYTAKAIKYKAD